MKRLFMLFMAIIFSSSLSVAQECAKIKGLCDAHPAAMLVIATIAKRANDSNMEPVLPILVECDLKKSKGGVCNSLYSVGAVLGTLINGKGQMNRMNVFIDKKNSSENGVMQVTKAFVLWMIPKDKDIKEIITDFKNCFKSQTSFNLVKQYKDESGQDMELTYISNETNCTVLEK